MVINESMVSHRPKSDGVSCRLMTFTPLDIPVDIAFILYERFYCRKEGLTKRSAQLKKCLEKKGYTVIDQEGASFTVCKGSILKC